jgi:hypothetical protein
VLLLLRRKPAACLPFFFHHVKICTSALPTVFVCSLASPPILHVKGTLPQLKHSMESSRDMPQADPFVDFQPDQPATTREMAQIDMDFDSSQVQVPRSRGNTPQSSQVNRLKYASPTSQPASSMTPPPSTQAQSQIQTIARTPSPLGLLNSPPPTTKQETCPSAPPISSIPSQDQINNASVEELRSLLTDVSGSLREAKTTAAHYKLQYNMLVIDSNKAKNEMDVELAMLQRELDVLQDAEDRRRATSTPLQSIEASNLAAIHDLTRQVDMLSLQNEDFKIALSQERRNAEQRDVRVASLEEQNACLRQRIRQNREHMNGILDNVLERSPSSAMNTPSRNSYFGTPRRAPMSTPGRQIERRDNLAFDALLLADKVLSQETATAPSTPKNQGRSGRPGHVRNTHSLSSLPSTPNRRIQPAGQILRTPLHMASILEPVEAPASVPHLPITHSISRRRRASSDSTITASEDERQGSKGGASRSHAQSPYDDVLPESSASQAATSMLRTTPKKAKTQSKIVGKVTKASTSYASKVSSEYLVSPEKRRIASGVPGAEAERRSGNDGSPKKRRVGNIGLGIGI